MPSSAARFLPPAGVGRTHGRQLRLEALEERRLLSVGPAGAGREAASLAVDPFSFDRSSMLVRFRPEAVEASSFAPGLDGSGLLGRSKIGPAWPIVPGLRKVELADGSDFEAALAAYRADPRVLYAEPDYAVHLVGVPNDPQFGSQWALHNVGQGGGTVDADVDAPEAWDRATGSGGTLVAVIDTGVDYNHPDLAANMWQNAAELGGRPNQDDDGNGYVDDVYGYDFVNHDGNPMDDQGHGTHVAGTIGAAGNNGLGVAGINWNVQLMALKFLDANGSGSTSDAIEALNYAVANGATISNNSWGGDPYSQALYDAIRSARDAGHIFVTAAGNGNWLGIGQDNDAAPFYPASYDLDNVVAVAATDRNDQLAVFSNYGATSVDLAAPGVDILSTVPGGSYATNSGTSMATPHVAGALALVEDLHDTWTYRQVIDQVLGTVDMIDAVRGKTVTGGRLNLAAAVTPDASGPRVTASSPSGTLLDPVGSVRLTFNETVEAASFTVEDVASFAGPQGAIAVAAVTAVAGSNGRQFDVTFPIQTAPGAYRMVIGPDVRDRSGNPMDQDADAANGETPDDQFAASFTLAQAVGRFDFGTASSPLAPNYTRIAGTRYDAAAGYGWLTGSINALDRGVGSDLTRDFNYTALGTFVLDVPNGNYDVTVTLGDSMQAHDQMGVFLEGLQVGSVTTAKGEFSTKTYTASVGDGQLTLTVDDLGGPDAYVIINALDVAVGGPDTTGPRVLEASPAGTATGPIDRVTLLFSEALADGSFTVDDVASLAGPSGAISPAAVNKLAANRYEVVFAPQNSAGSYSLSVGPAILDLAGNAMDQDQDKVPGEVPEDRFTASFTVQPGPTYLARFDFGTASSPVAQGYTRIAATKYDAAAGYGWQSGYVYALDRGVGTELTRDFNYTALATFALDVPNGNYDVTVTLGDSMQAHDNMAVLLEGVQVDVVTTAKGQFSAKTYTTSVGDGQLSLQLKDVGGPDAYVMVVALDVALGGPDTTGPRVTEAAPAGTATGPIDRVTLSFSEALADGSFTVNDVVSLAGPSGAISPMAVNKLAANRYEVVFAPQNAAGSYSLSVGPAIFDLAGNAMDQDQDGETGEVPGDQFTAAFSVVPGPTYVARFDFGTASSPVAQGYTRVAAGRYDAALGYGWQSGYVYAFDRGVGTELTRDFNYTNLATFAVNLANGDYDVTVTLGDSMVAHDQMAVFLEGVQVDTVTTARGQFSIKTHAVSVGDGQLTLQLKDLGGTDIYAMINALDVAVAAGTGAAGLAAAGDVRAALADLIWRDGARRSTAAFEEMGTLGFSALPRRAAARDRFFAVLEQAPQAALLPWEMA